MGRSCFYPSLFFLFFSFFQTKFICSLLIKGSIVCSSLYIIEQQFYSRDFIIKTRVLSGWVVQFKWKILFYSFSDETSEIFIFDDFFFFLRLNSDRQFVESYWGREVNEINVEMDFANFILLEEKLFDDFSNENSIHKDLHIRF